MCRPALRCLQFDDRPLNTSPKVTTFHVTAGKHEVAFACRFERGIFSGLLDQQICRPIHVQIGNHSAPLDGDPPALPRFGRVRLADQLRRQQAPNGGRPEKGGPAYG